MEETKMADERFSFKGWDWKVWLSKNKDSAKNAIAVVLGLGATLVSNLPPKWSVPLGTVCALATRLALDAFDYFIAENPK